MSRYLSVDKLWSQSELPVFLERFILVVLATAFWQVVMVNAMKLDIHYRAGIAIVLVGVAYITAHAVQTTKTSADRATATNTVKAAEPNGLNIPENHPLTHAEPKSKAGNQIAIDSNCSNASIAAGGNVTNKCSTPAPPTASSTEK
jgi:hypothetical protein